MAITRSLPEKDTITIVLRRLKDIRDKLTKGEVLTENEKRVLNGEFDFSLPDNPQEAIKHINLRIREYEHCLHSMHISDKS